MINIGIESVALGLVAALTWGAGDFSGGVATKRASAYSVVIVAHIASLFMVVGLAILFKEPVPPLQSWLWGGVAGLCGGFGLILLYSALAGGRMSLAAPVSALVAAAIPVIIAAFTQGLPGLLVMIGFAIALAAIWLVSGGGGHGFRLADLRTPMVAGVSFGLFFICLHQASGESILWPIVAVRIVSISSLLGYSLLTRQSIIPSRASLFPILMSGLLDTIGNGAYALAAQLGRVDVAAVLGSLYPGSTVLLAWLILKERMSGKQILGIAAALAAIVLITL
ncbi:MAG: DMT family transporter [Chloroflexi bacterium]|nr:MAG: DMT family transporter [Chloroflexota bacterium]